MASNIPGSPSDAGETWAAANGTKVDIRSIGSEDFAALRVFVNALSPRTGYMRLMSLRVPTDAELRAWSDPRPGREVALVANVANESGERLVGVARFVVEEPGVAEFAVVIADDWQRRGLGRKLIQLLVERAKQARVSRLYGTTLAGNTAMLGLARALHFELQRGPDSALMYVVSTDPQQTEADA